MFRTATNGINLQTQLNFQEYLLIRELFTMKRKRTKNESKFAVLIGQQEVIFLLLAQPLLEETLQQSKTLIELPKGLSLCITPIHYSISAHRPLANRRQWL